MEEMRIKVAPETLLAISGDVEQKISNVQNAFEQMESIVKSSVNYWEGMGQSAYHQAYQSRKDEYEEVLSSFKEHIVNLQQIAGVYQQTETSITDFTQVLLTAIIE